jgi:hypothetical protein
LDDLIAVKKTPKCIFYRLSKIRIDILLQDQFSNIPARTYQYLQKRYLFFRYRLKGGTFVSESSIDTQA